MRSTSRRWLSQATTIAAETLWPTRCVLCDKLGVLLCDDCRLTLPYIDTNRSCGRCGAAGGYLQCCQCNGHSMRVMGLDHFILDQLVSVMELNTESHKIVTAFKDHGEQRLARLMAEMMAACLPPSWLHSSPTITAIPTTKKAHRRRGFDPAKLLAETLSRLISRPFASLLQTPKTADQRQLNRHERFENVTHGLSVKPSHLATKLPQAIIIVDDVATTGATLYAAAAPLRTAGVQEVYGLTFART